MALSFGISSYYLVHNVTNTNGSMHSHQARRRLGEILSGIMSERRERGDLGDDLLGTLMGRGDDDGGAAFSDDQVADNAIGVLFAAQDTTASVLTWILKFLHDNTKLLEAVKVSSRRRPSSQITREEPMIGTG
jgi:cytochrome P450